MNLKEGVVISVIVLILVGGGLFSYFSYFPQEQNSNFEVNLFLLKAVIKQGETSSTHFNINNLEGERNFSIEVIALDKVVSLSENNFTLIENEEKKIEVSFDGDDLEPGVYVGSLLVKNGIYEKKIPVVFEIQTSSTFFAINLDVNPEYKEIDRGGNTLTKIEFFNLKDSSTHEAEIEYVIKDVSGEIIASEEEKITIGSRFLTTKTISLPDDIARGDYIYTVKLNYNGYVSTSSYIFKVVDKKIEIFFFDINFLSFLVLIFLFIILILTIYLFVERFRLSSVLRKHHASELKIMRSHIEKQKKESLAHAKTKKEQKKIISEFEDAKGKIITEMKKEQNREKTEINKLKKTTDRKVLHQKVEKWRKEIYPKVVKSAQISHELKSKLGTLETAYSEGLISKDSLRKGKSRIKSAHKKLNENE